MGKKEQVPALAIFVKGSLWVRGRRLAGVVLPMGDYSALAVFHIVPLGPPEIEVEPWDEPDEGGPQQELARPRRGVGRGGLQGIAVRSSWQEGQGACRGQGAGEARGLAGGSPLRGGEPGWRRRLPQRHPHAG